MDWVCTILSKVFLLFLIVLCNWIQRLCPTGSLKPPFSLPLSVGILWSSFSLEWRVCSTIQLVTRLLDMPDCLDGLASSRAHTLGVWVEAFRGVPMGGVLSWERVGSFTLVVLILTCYQLPLFVTVTAMLLQLLHTQRPPIPGSQGCIFFLLSILGSMFR